MSDLVQPYGAYCVERAMTHSQHITTDAPVEGPESRPPLEIALLTWEYPPIPSARGRTACEVAHALAGLGANVRVFTMDRDDVVSSDDERIEVIGCAGRVTGLRRLMKQMPGMDLVAYAAAFRERVAEEHERHPFDLIEATSSGAPAAMLMDCGLPVVIRTSTPDELNTSLMTKKRSRLSQTIVRGMEARCARRAAAVISNSRSHAVFVKQHYDLRPGNIHMVTPMSVDPEIAKTGRTLAFPPADAILRLAYITDGSERKSISETLLAFDILVGSAVEDEAPLPELHVVGLDEGHLAFLARGLHLSEQTIGQILDFGRLTDPSLSQVLQRCQGVLAPSHYQSTGSVYREAAAFGRPLIASMSDPFAADFVHRHQSGTLARSCDPTAIAEAVMDLFSDRDRVLELRRNGIEAAEKWTREELGVRTFQIYRRAMNLAPISISGVADEVVSERPRYISRI